MNCYGLGESLWVNPVTGLLEVRLADGSGLEIIEGDGLSLQEPQKQPVWTTWTPTLTNMVQGNGTITARYFNQGGLVMFSFTFALGTTSSMGTEPSFSAPVPISDWGKFGNNGAMPFGQVSVEDSGTTNYQGICMNITNTDNNIVCRMYNQGGTFGQSSQITSTVPMTWTTNDTIQARGWYKSSS